MTGGTLFYSEKNARQNSNCVIVVEGPDDVYFIGSLLDEIKADPVKVGIVHVSGRQHMAPYLESFLKSSSFTQGKTQTVAIICDADLDPIKVETEINAVLAGANQPILQLGKHVANVSGVRFGLFAMPDSANKGDLEKLCLDTVSGHTLEKSAEGFLTTAETEAMNAGKILNGSRHKRKAQVFLAGLPNDLARGAGRGYANGCFNSAHAALQPIKTFLLATVT